MEEFAYFAVRYIPSILVCIGCYAANLYTFCDVINRSDLANATSVDCRLAFGDTYVLILFFIAAEESVSVIVLIFFV
jgi:hypothetical protein